LVEYEVIKYSESPETITIPGDLGAPPAEPGYRAAETIVFYARAADGATVVEYRDMDYAGSLLHPWTYQSVHYDIERETTWRLSRPSGLAPTDDGEIRLDISSEGFVLGATDTPGTTGYSRWEWSIETEELGTLFESCALATQGAMPAIAGDIPASAFIVAPGRLELTGYATQLVIPVPADISELNFKMKLRTVGDGMDFTVPARATMTHSMDPVSIVPAVTRACGELGPPLRTTDNGFYRSFDLGAMAGKGFQVTELDLAISEATHPAGSQIVELNLYRDVDGGEPHLLDLQPLGSSRIPVHNQAGMHVTVPVLGNLGAGTLVAEVRTRDYIPLDKRALFFIGANSAGETAPSYIQADDCDINEITPMAGIGEPNTHIVMTLLGYTYDASCYPDCDGNGVLDFFDFLCFQNAFATGDMYADCDGNGLLDFFDFLCFQNAFAAGCP
ncbi:MAG: GC-type dockerin domain-anchored protein, partial [Phycisphaerales bacterium JB039]